MAFVHPCTVLVAGPTQCGKTQLVKRILKEKNFTPFPERIVWCYGEWQPTYDEIKLENPQVQFVKGLDEEVFESFSPDKRNLVILDDLMSEIGGSEKLSTLFTKGSHHRNLSVIYIVQNLFDKGKSHRTCSLNTHYMLAFKNPRDMNQINTLGYQMVPGKKFKLSDVMEDIAKVPHGYLLIDCRQDTPPIYKFRTFIFPHEHQRLYVPNV